MAGDIDAGAAIYGSGDYEVKQIVSDTIEGVPCLELAVYGYGLNLYHLDDGSLDHHQSDKQNLKQ